MKRNLIILALFICVIGFGQYQTTNLDFLFNGSIAVNGSDTLLVDSITGTFDTGYILTFVDFDIALGYIPAKTNARLNGQPICTYFENANYADTLFTQWIDQELNADSTELYPRRIQRIAHYSTPTTDINDFFQTPPKATSDFTEVGVGKTYSTISAAISGSGVGDTIYVYDGDYDETNFLNWRLQDVIAVGDCKITSTGTLYVVLSSLETEATLSGFEIDGENNTSHCFLGSSTFNNKHIKNCYFTNATLDVVKFTTTSILDQNYSITSSVFSDEPEIECDVNVDIRECYFNNTAFRAVGLIDTLSIKYCLFKSTSVGNNVIAINSFNNKAIINYNDFIDIKAVNMIAATQTILRDKFEFFGNYVTSDSIVTSSVQPNLYDSVLIRNNIFINNSGNTVSNILFQEFRKAYIRNNIFYTPTGDIYPIRASSSSAATEIYIESNLDSTYSDAGYFIRVGNELTSALDNNIPKIVIKNNEGYGHKYFTPSATPTSHGIFIGFESGNQTVAYNNNNGFGLNHVFKGSTGTNSSNVKIWGNLSSNAYQYGFYPKGVDSLKFYNNTSYNDAIGFYFTENTGSDPAIHCEVRNNIIESPVSGYAYYFDLASSNNFNSSNNVVYGGIVAYYNNITYDWSTWQGLGQDANSFNTDPLFKSQTQLWPTSGSDAIWNGLNLGTSYNQGLNTNSIWPDNVNLKTQVNKWDIGAYIIDKPLMYLNKNNLTYRNKNGLIYRKNN
jgi:hypothetical protein